MKFIKQFGIILAVSFLGEILNHLIPLPIPSSIYGLIFMLLCLATGLLRVEAVKDTAYYLIEIMPLMFIPTAVGLITSWSVIRENLLAYVVITVASTVAVMFVSGRVTQAVLQKKRGEAQP